MAGSGVKSAQESRATLIMLNQYLLLHDLHPVALHANYREIFMSFWSGPGLLYRHQRRPRLRFRSQLAVAVGGTGNG